MKLIIQIPCYNEEATLPQTVRDLPRRLPGVDEIEYLLVDDGCIDRTVEVARELGIEHVVHFKRHRGLARAFAAGLEAALAAGADVVVNTDADNQYRGEDVVRLLQPILEGRADIVVGDRGVAALAHFSLIKRLLQRWGSWVVSRAAGIPIPDATSGFRAFTRQAALRLVVSSDYTHTLETLFQAGACRMAVAHVPVRTNPQTRPSRLIGSTLSFLLLSTIAILRFYIMYRPLRVFTTAGGALVASGAVLGLRFLYFFLLGGEAGKIQSLILAAILTVVGFQVCLIGLIADLVRMNRKMLEEALYRLRYTELETREKEERPCGSATSAPIEQTTPATKS